MSSIQQSVTRLIESARHLRDAADQLGNADLKAQIVEEISSLKDLREVLAGEGDSTVDLPAGIAAAAQSSQTALDKPKPLGDNSMSVYTPSKNSGTYALTEEKVEFEEAVHETAKKKPPAEDPERKAKRAAEAEKVIAELEPILQDALRSMNDCLTPEQKKIKVRETKAGEAAGKSAAEIRNAVFSAMKLSDEQKIRISDARKQIAQIRTSIAEELTYLKEDQQRAQVEGQSHGKSFRSP
ncbi:MAG: hypothetical protein O3C17_26650 [Planctomycetota bacterium]|nr:hypothetical protein [Planctomycetota bacterium]